MRKSQQQPRRTHFVGRHPPQRLARRPPPRPHRGGARCALSLRRGLFWTVGVDPILSVILGAAPAYFFGAWFTENIFAQKPLVTQASCPECQYLFTIYFGDLFAVQSDGIVAGGVPGNTVECKCPQPSCKIDLEADREKMLLITTASKIPAKA